MLLRQIAGAVARRIIWYVKEGQPVQQGEEFGFIKFGSRVDVFLPLDAEIKVKIGDVTRGGVTVIAELIDTALTGVTISAATVAVAALFVEEPADFPGISRTVRADRVLAGSTTSNPTSTVPGFGAS